MTRFGFAWLLAATALAAPGARAQNAPLSGLPQRGTVQSTDIIPIMPAGGAQLDADHRGRATWPGGGAGSVTSITCGAGLTGGTITTTGTCALAMPSATTLGGIESFAAQTHEFINAISTAGVPSAAQPACADLSDATYCNVSLTNGLTLANLAQAGANSLLGNAGASTANVADVPVPSCSAAGYALNWTSGAGFGCVNVGGTGVAPNLLKFGPPTVIPYYDPQPSGLIDVTDTFGSTGTFTKINVAGTSSFTVAGNVGTVTYSGAANAMLLETADATLVAPNFFNAIEVTAQTPSSGYFNMYSGACLNAANYVAGYYDAVGHAIHSEYSYSGTVKNSSLKTVTLTPPYWIGASLVGNNNLSVWYKTSATGVWLYAGSTLTSSFFDYSVAANFATAGYKTCVYGVSDGSGSVSVANLQGGRFGGVAMRDIKPVVNTDWTTYEPGSNTVYFDATVVDPTGAGGMGVFTLDLATQAITQTGVVCDTRTVSSVSHTYCGDSAGSVVYHSNGDREVLLSSWATGFSNSTPVQVLYKYLTYGAQPDVLTNNLSVLSMTQLTLPLGSEIGAYDAALAYDSVHALYRMAYTVCGDCTFATSTTTTNFYPAQATASTPTGTWSGVGIDTAAIGNYEGTSWANVSGVLYELAGGPHYSTTPTLGNCTSARVYDETMTYQGGLLGATFDTTATAAYPCSHPTLFQHPDGEHTVLFTFLGGEFTGGNLSSVGQPAIEISTP